jgi:hypothetical protein
MNKSSEPYDNWYASNNPYTYDVGAADAGTDSLHRVAGLMRPGNPAMLSPNTCSCGARCNCHQKEHFSVATGSKGCGCNTTNTKNTKKSKVSKEHFDDSYKTTDPRFLYGSAALHFNVGSDTQDITRTYGTVSQKKRYPRLADFLNYGITGTIDSSS